MAEARALTLPALLDRAEALLRRTAPGRPAVPARAYAADEHGTVTTFGFPVPADEAGREALSAILDLELRKRGATVCVIALERWAKELPAEADARQELVEEAAERQECVVLTGFSLAGARRREVRVLEVRRRGGRIEGVRRWAGGSGRDEASSRQDAVVCAAVGIPRR
jgi:hypothetical protein